MHITCRLSDITLGHIMLLICKPEDFPREFCCFCSRNLNAVVEKVHIKAFGIGVSVEAVLVTGLPHSGQSVVFYNPASDLNTLEAIKKESVLFFPTPGNFDTVPI